MTGATLESKLRHMVRIHVCLRPEELEALRRTARREGMSTAELVRQAARRTWLRPAAQGPVGLGSGVPRCTALEHDTVHGEL